MKGNMINKYFIIFACLVTALTVSAQLEMTFPSDEGVEIGLDDAFYFGDPDTDGSWRIIRCGANLQFQLRIGETWTMKSEITP